MKSNEFGILEIRESSLLIDDGAGAVAIAKHADDDGEYFLDQQLEKVYLRDAKLLGSYTFKTDLYDRHDRVWHSETRTFRAASLDEAKQMQRAYYGTPFDRTLIAARDFEGNEIEIDN